MQQAQRTVTTMSELGSAASRIGEVIGLIQAIADGTFGITKRPPDGGKGRVHPSRPRPPNR